ncbi:hypothetical protein [Acidocella sp.]|uniref:hypothetical protein n=1 Tax=Acidocella sp. TaxID=50710 RepID=UPI0026349E2C|nr:hypothetical protein [Acidocella sp.]
MFEELPIIVRRAVAILALGALAQILNVDGTETFADAEFLIVAGAAKMLAEINDGYFVPGAEKPLEAGLLPQIEALFSAGEALVLKGDAHGG